ANRCFDTVHRLWWGSPPVRTWLSLLRCRRQDRHQGVLCQLASWCRNARVANKGTLAHFGKTGGHPAAAEFIAADKRVIGKESAVFNFGEFRNHHGGGDFHVLANCRAQRTQPQRGELTGIEWEEVGAGIVHQLFDGPNSPTTRRTNRKDSRLQPNR